MAVLMAASTPQMKISNFSDLI